MEVIKRLITRRMDLWYAGKIAELAEDIVHAAKVWGGEGGHLGR